jgi:deoxyribodipyrimidine photo-lyase
MYKLSLFLFHRDLRLDDNKGLLAGLEQSQTVIPCFILDDAQVNHKRNHYFTHNGLQFMIESLHDLDADLRKKNSFLHIFYGKTLEVIEMLLTTLPIEAVFSNRDYTPFSMQRDESIKHLCLRQTRNFELNNDLLLHEPEEILTGNGTPYAKFTPFFKSALGHAIDKPESCHYKNFYSKTIASSVDVNKLDTILSDYQYNSSIHVNGGTTHAKKILSHLDKFKHYSNDRNYPALQTTNLSAHLKFGTVSVRHAYESIAEQLGKNHLLVQQLHWRDFFTHVAYNSPSVFGHAFQQKFDAIVWEDNASWMKRWAEGETGFPIVDAGMRQLNQTGFMHNRVRMIVASFLTKDLHIDWRIGERYFAQQLVDYDPCVNNGNWQWSASTGCDAQPYFRIFNPWLQQKKFDPDCVYIKRWVPELRGISVQAIHAWNSAYSTFSGYPKPMIDHAQESAKTKLYYKKAAHTL